MADAHSLLCLNKRSPVLVRGVDSAMCTWTRSKISPPLCLLLRDACQVLSVTLPPLLDTSNGMKKAGLDPGGELVRSHRNVLSLHREDLIQVFPGCCTCFPLFHFSIYLVSFPLILFSYYNLTPISFFLNFFSSCWHHHLSEPFSLLSIQEHWLLLTWTASQSPGFGSVSSASFHWEPWFFFLVMVQEYAITSSPTAAGAKSVERVLQSSFSRQSLRRKFSPQIWEFWAAMLAKQDSHTGLSQRTTPFQSFRRN